MPPFGRSTAIPIIITLVACGHSFANGSTTWKYWHDENGVYANELNGTKSEIRFIRLLVSGKVDKATIKGSFLDAARLYHRDNITVSAGGNNRFIKVSRVSRSSVPVIGWYDYARKRFAYIAITKISNGRVYYESHRGTTGSRGSDPSNFPIKSLVGSTDLDWKVLTTHVSVQVWKHNGNDGPYAAVCPQFNNRVE